MRLIAPAHSPDAPEIEAVMILGLTVGVLLIRYFSLAANRIEGDHWFAAPEEAKERAVDFYGVRPHEWQELPADPADRLCELSVMPINALTCDPDADVWKTPDYGDYSLNLLNDKNRFLSVAPRDCRRRPARVSNSCQ